MRNLAVGIATVILSGVACAIPGRVPRQPEAIDWDWLRPHRDKAFDALMPLDPPALVSYRSHGYQPETVERYFSIGYGPGTGYDRNDLQATVVLPVDRSIQRQLLDLHMQDGAAAFESVLSRVSVRRVLIRAPACRAVIERIDSLPTVLIKLEERDVVYIHAPVHRIVIAVAGGTIEATLEDEAHALVRWAVQTHDALLACTRTRSGDDAAE
jgi:hypothetical protein